jgi:predicted nucleotidyltransferase
MPFPQSSIHSVHPIFEEARSIHPTISQAGVFGSVSRGAQRYNSDVDILVGHSKYAEFWRDVCGSFTGLMASLSEVLVVPYVQNRERSYVHMETLLTVKIIWRDALWLMMSRDSAENILRQGRNKAR